MDPDDAHLRKLGRGSASDLGDSQLDKLDSQVLLNRQDIKQAKALREIGRTKEYISREVIQRHRDADSPCLRRERDKRAMR
jgi:hypothetical protein